MRVSQLRPHLRNFLRLCPVEVVLLDVDTTVVHLLMSQQNNEICSRNTTSLRDRVLHISHSSLNRIDFNDFERMFIDILKLEDEFIVLLVAFVKSRPIVDPNEKPVGIVRLKFFPTLLDFNFEHKMAVDI